MRRARPPDPPMKIMLLLSVTYSFTRNNNMTQTIKPQSILLNIKCFFVKFIIW